MSIKLLQNISSTKDEIIYLLNQLSSCENITDLQYRNIITYLKNNFFHKIFVYELLGKPIGLITLIIEQKIIHSGRSVGHIEDLIVDKNHRGTGIAEKLIEYAINMSTFNNCYKLILDCDEKLIHFYQKKGFHKKAIQMRMDL